MKLSVLALVTLSLTNLCSYSCTEIKQSEELQLLSITSNTTAENENGIQWLSYSHSPVDLWHLTSLEERLLTIINDYIAQLDTEPGYFLKRYMADYEDSTLVAFNSWDSTKAIDKKYLIHRNPLWAYRMIWRFVTDFPQIQDALLSSGNSEIINALNETTYATSANWPNQKDLNNSMGSLLNLHFVYDLNATEFSNGIIHTVVTNASLSAIHCFEIAKYALTTQKYTLALEWLEVAETKRLNVSGHPILDYIEETAVAELIENIISKHDAVWAEEQPHHLNLYQYFDKIDSNYVLLPQKKVLQQVYKKRGNGTYPISLDDVAAFSTLCKGGNLLSEKEKSKLYCWYESKMNPFWYINPQKMELYSKDPYIFQVYDFVGEKLIQILKKEAIPKMERAMVSNSYPKDMNNTENTDSGDKNPGVTNPADTNTGNKNSEDKKLGDTDSGDKNPGDTNSGDTSVSEHYSETRTSMYAWLEEKEFAPRLPLLMEKINYLTGLSSSWEVPDHTSSSVQVAIYATGGYFNVHIDSLESTADFHNLVEQNIGDRLATFMLYLNDVELGGGTAFTSVGVTVPPVKGSAVFWYDSKYNGEVDYRVWHGGCPVLIGEKWVGNKWIHNNLNILIRKCTLNKDE